MEVSSDASVCAHYRVCLNGKNKFYNRWGWVEGLIFYLFLTLHVIMTSGQNNNDTKKFAGIITSLPFTFLVGLCASGLTIINS